MKGQNAMLLPQVQQASTIFNYLLFLVHFKKKIIFPESDEEEYSSESDEEEEQQNLGDKVKNQVTTANDLLMEGNISLSAES